MIYCILFIYLSSDEAQSDEQKKQEKSKRLEQRRSHLSSILEAEKNQFQVRIFVSIYKKKLPFLINSE